MSGTLTTETFTVPSGGSNMRVECFRCAADHARPLVVLLHGSDAFEMHGLFYRQMGRQFARAGFVALLPHYYDRTGSRYLEDDTGRRAMIGTHFESWRAAVGDVIRYAGSLPGVNVSRTGLFGVSLGAAVALGVASSTPEVRCVVEYFGWLHQSVDASALPPTLVLHGDSDEVIPLSEGNRLAEALAAADRPFEMRIYPGQGHGFTGEAGRDAYQRALEFLKRHLMP